MTDHGIACACETCYEARLPEMLRRPPVNIGASTIAGPCQQPSKPRLSLLPWRAMPTLARVFESGLKGDRVPHDYRQVPDRERAYVDKALRHLAAHLRGELLDESGETHLAHACADLMIAIETEGT